jgi:hypothetical protein
MNPGRQGQRTALREQICALIEDIEDKDPRLGSIVALALGELFNLAGNLDRLAEAGECQAEALERIHSRLGLGLTEGTCDLARLADTAQRLADMAPRFLPDSCPQCGAQMLRATRP